MPIADPPRLHPILEAASRGELPDWAEVEPVRREHMARVAGLLGDWAEARRENPVERDRWVAAGFLHDALRDADPERLRSRVDPTFRAYPGKVLHGPAAAQRLQESGVEDEDLLHAIRFHTLGTEDFGTLGLALYAADFLEPGRQLQDEWRADLRLRAPADLTGVVREILEARIQYLVGQGRPLRHETVAFWNRMTEGRAWARASEL